MQLTQSTNALRQQGEHPMKRRRCPGRIHYTVALLLACLGVLFTSGSAVARPPCVSSLSKCDSSGCGGDGDLNQMKNRTDEPSEFEEWTVSEVLTWEYPSKSEWSERSELEEWGDGAPVRLTGYLIYAAVTKTPESCNCYLTGGANNDFHLNLVGSKSDLKTESVVAEITPRFRPEGWDIAKLKSLAKKNAYVRMTGWLMLDTMHLGGSQGRGTPWEVHPVTECEVCTSTKANCDKDKPGVWKPLADYEE